MTDALATALADAAGRWTRITGYDAASAHWRAVQAVLATCGLVDANGAEYALFHVDDPRSARELEAALIGAAHYAVDHGLDVAEATEATVTLIKDFYGVEGGAAELISRLREELPWRIVGMHDRPSAALRQVISNTGPVERDILATLVLERAAADDAFSVAVFGALAQDPSIRLKIARTCGGRWIVYSNSP